LTPEGRALCEQLQAAVPREQPDRGAALERALAAFPRDLKEIRQRGLAYFRYSLLDRSMGPAGEWQEATWDQLVDAGVVAAHAMRYDDFLPVSAAGIFRSNLGGAAPRTYDAAGSRRALEAALGRPILDADVLCASAQAESIEAVRRQLSTAHSASVLEVG
jgi:uncharacterized glyoxalase superfamily metalloenzyme YdcJ